MILSGWKDIARHLGRGVRTAQRWEKLGLPVRRPRAKSRSAVVALSEELDSWLKSTSQSILAASKDQPGHGFKHRVLVVDDDEQLLVTQSAILIQEGYETRTARDGFEALAEMRSGVPDVLISDLRMPNMSGFELLSVVRRKFPSIAVIAMSGEFTPATVPAILCDRYIEKGPNSPVELLGSIRELLAQSPLRSQPAKFDIAPAWVPRSSNGYVVLTCISCLRSFSANVLGLKLGEEGVEACVHCGTNVRYWLDSSSIPAASEIPSLVEHSNRLVRLSNQKKYDSRSA